MSLSPTSLSFSPSETSSTNELTRRPSVSVSQQRPFPRLSTLDVPAPRKHLVGRRNASRVEFALPYFRCCESLSSLPLPSVRLRGAEPLRPSLLRNLQGVDSTMERDRRTVKGFFDTIDAKFVHRPPLPLSFLRLLVR